MKINRQGNNNFFWSLLVRTPPPILHYCRCARTRPVVQCKEFYVPLLQLYGVFYNTECTGLLLRWNVQHSTCAVPLPPPPPTSKSACPTPLVSQPPEDRGPSLVKQSRQISYPGHPSHPGHPFGPCLLVHLLGTANQPPENADFRSQAQTLSSNQSKEIY